MMGSEIAAQARVSSDDHNRAQVREIEEARLIAAARADPEAFVVLYRRYVGPVHRYLLAQVGHRADAEDLTATVFTKALAGLDQYAAKGSVAAWLFAIARHTLRDHQRRRRPMEDVAPIAMTLADEELLPEEGAIGRERAAFLHRLVRELPPDQRDTIALHFFAGLPTAEIAALQGRSGGAIRMRLHRALAALRARYHQEEPT